MMNTFLDVGINETIAEGIANKTGNKWFAWDSYRRFLQCYGMAFGMERDLFDAIIAHFKKKWNIHFKRKFSGEQMREVALEMESAGKANDLAAMAQAASGLRSQFELLKTAMEETFLAQAEGGA